MTGVDTRVDIAPGAVLTADPLSWDWTNVTTSTRTDRLDITHGKASSGANEMAPGSMSFLVSNPGGIHSPGRADSPYYPNLKQGMPVRAVVTGQRDPYLALTGDAGSSASTPDNAALDIVGDIAVAVEWECPLRVPQSNANHLEWVSKWVVAGNQQSWRLLMRPSGSLIFQWTTGGSDVTLESRDTALALPLADAGILTVGLYLDVDNGAGGHDLYWYVAPNKTIDDLTASPATYEVEHQVLASTTSIFSSTANMEIGDNPGASVQPPAPGKARRLIVRSGTMAAGTIVANPTFTSQVPATGSFTDSASRVWTVNSPASIIDDQVRMLGELNSATPGWPGGGDNNPAAEIQWDVQGPLSRLRQGEKPVQSALYRIVTQQLNKPFVVAYWPLEDGPDSTAGFSPIRNVQPLNTGGTDWEWASDASNPASHSNPHVNGNIAFGAQVPPYSGTQSRVDMFVKIPTPNATPATFVVGIETTGTVRRWTLSVDSTNVGVLGTDASGTSLVSSASAVSAAAVFGGWSLWSFNITQNGGNVDWNLTIIASETGASVGYTGSVAATVGTVTALHNWLTPAPTSGGISFGHFIVTTGLALGWLAPADSAYRGEPAGRRFYRLCQENGIQGLVNGVHGLDWAAVLAAGGKPMGPQRPAKLLELLEECARVENARIGESKELRALTYRSSHDNQVPALTITRELGVPFVPTGDTQDLVNDVTVSLPASTSYRQVDQASIDESDLYDDTRTVNAFTRLQLPDLASWWLHEGTWPGMRVPLLRILLSNTPGLYDLWLAAQPGDLIRFNLLPTGFNETPLDVLVDGWTEELSKSQWALSLNVSPAGPWEVGVRNSATLGIRDTGGSVLNSSFAAGTATTMSVATTLGPLWAVTAATNTALPFDVNVGGARITVTAIGAAAGSVQTFTVTQAPVNGIVKTVPAGTAVSVWRPARRSL